MDEQRITRLPDWAGVRAHLAARHATSNGPGEQIDVTVGTTPSPVQLRPIDVHGAPWIEVFAVLGRNLRGIAPTPALIRNFEIAIGQLGMKDGSLVIRQLLPLAGVRAEDLDEVVQAMADLIVESLQK